MNADEKRAEMHAIIDVIPDCLMGAYSISMGTNSASVQTKATQPILAALVTMGIHLEVDREGYIEGFLKVRDCEFCMDIKIVLTTPTKEWSYV